MRDDRWGVDWLWHDYVRNIEVRLFDSPGVARLDFIKTPRRRTWWEWLEPNKKGTMYRRRINAPRRHSLPYSQWLIKSCLPLLLTLSTNSPSSARCLFSFISCLRASWTIVWTMFRHRRIRLSSYSGRMIFTRNSHASWKNRAVIFAWLRDQRARRECSGSGCWKEEMVKLFRAFTHNVRVE